MDHKKEASCKSEPPLKNIDEVIKDCHEVADKFKIESLGDTECLVPPEVE